MIRAQILFTPELYEELKNEAERKQESISSLVREAVALKVMKKKKSGREILLGMAKHAFSASRAPRDLSTNDEYLYGKDAP